MKHYCAKPLAQAVHWAQYCISNDINASCSQGSKHMRYSQVIHTTSLGRSRSKSQECILHACAQLHNVQQYHVCHRAYSAVSAVYSMCADSQEASLPVCYNQWWTSHVAGSTAGCTYCLFCPSKARQGVRKAAVTSKWCQNSWTKRFQRKSHGKNLEYTIKNPIKLCLRCKNKVGSRFGGNRQTDTHTHTQTKWLL